jgi:hypothetical protein
MLTVGMVVKPVSDTAVVEPIEPTVVTPEKPEASSVEALVVAVMLTTSTPET